MNNIPDQLVWFFIGVIIGYFLKIVAPLLKEQYLQITGKSVQIQQLGATFTSRQFTKLLEKERTRIYGKSKEYTLWIIKEIEQIRVVIRSPGRDTEYFFAECALDSFLSKYSLNRGANLSKIIQVIIGLANNHTAKKKEFNTEKEALQMLGW